MSIPKIDNGSEVSNSVSVKSSIAEEVKHTGHVYQLLTPLKNFSSFCLERIKSVFSSCLENIKSLIFKLSTAKTPLRPEEISLKKESKPSFNDNMIRSIAHSSNILPEEEKKVEISSIPSLESPSSTQVFDWGELKKATEKLAINFIDKKEVLARFKDVSCPQETALQVQGHYLHANWVGEKNAGKEFIATQAPLLPAFPLFWQSVFENTSLIFDLTTEKDNLEPYYPLNTEKGVAFGNVTVLLKEAKTDEKNITTSKYLLKNEAGEEKTITRINYPWMDFSTTSMEGLETLVEQIETRENKETPPMVHCRAGVGRTGTLIAAAILKQKIGENVITKGNLEQALFNLVLRMRQQRGPLFVQTPEQWNFLLEYGKKLLNEPNLSQNI